MGISDDWMKMYVKHQGRYHEFVKQHREAIRAEIAEDYKSFGISKEHREEYLKDSEFIYYVGIPLFVCWLIIVFAYCRRLFCADTICVSAMFTGLFFSARYASRRAIKRVCEQIYMRNRKPWELLKGYVERCRVEALESVKDEAERIEVNEFYDYCKKEIEGDLHLFMDDK